MLTDISYPISKKCKERAGEEIPPLPLFLSFFENLEENCDCEVKDPANCEVYHLKLN